jgi:hypothetical protein
MRSRLSLAVVVLFCGGCAEKTVLTRADATAEDFARDRQHCQAEMYTQRMARGRSAPSWLIYDYCMKARGYTREKASGREIGRRPRFRALTPIFTERS